MSSETWALAKYVELKRNGRECTKDVFLILEKPRRSLVVLSEGAEIERVFYHMDASRYPFFKMKDTSLFVHFNSSGQGFRVKFISLEERTSFFNTIHKLTFISESPAKSLTNSEDSPILDQILASNRAKGKTSARRLASSSCSQQNWPTTSSVRDSYRPDYFSQPVSHPLPAPLNLRQTQYSQPGSSSRSAWNIPSSPSEYDQFDRMSIASSYSSFGGGFANSPSHFSSSQPTAVYDSQKSSDPFTPPIQVAPMTEDKACQTDNSLEGYNNNPKMMMELIKHMMKNSEFVKLINSTRESIRELPESEKKELFSKVTPEVQLNLRKTVKRVREEVGENKSRVESKASHAVPPRKTRSSKNAKNDTASEASCSSSKKPKFRQLSDKFSLSQR